MNLKLFLRTIITYIGIFIYFLIYIIPCFIIALLPAQYRYNNKLFYKLLDRFFKGVIKSTILNLDLVGKENIINPSIIVANHQSSFDIPLVGSLLDGYPHIWLVMSYYLSSPVLGFFIKRMFIPVDQSKSNLSASSLIRVINVLRYSNKSFVIFPEGGRFLDGKIHKFYSGFAIVAKKTNLPVIPVYIVNNGKIYPPYSFFIYNYPIKLVVGKPFYFSDDDNIDDFTKKVEDWFIKQNNIQLKQG